MGDQATERTSLAINADDIDELLSDHFTAGFGPDRMSALGERFHDEHVVPLHRFCPPALLEAMRNEAFSIMDRFGVASDFNFEIKNTTFASRSDLDRPMTHETNDLLFGGGPAGQPAER